MLHAKGKRIMHGSMVQLLSKLEEKSKHQLVYMYLPDRCCAHLQILLHRDRQLHILCAAEVELRHGVFLSLGFHRGKTADSEASKEEKHNEKGIGSCLRLLSEFNRASRAVSS
jgi:hypothetical protein